MEQGAGADLFDFCHQSSSLITSNTRDSERKANGQRESLARHSHHGVGLKRIPSSTVQTTTRPNTTTLFPRHVEIAPDLYCA